MQYKIVLLQCLCSSKEQDGYQFVREMCIEKLHLLNEKQLFAKPSINTDQAW